MDGVVNKIGFVMKRYKSKKKEGTNSTEQQKF